MVRTTPIVIKFSHVVAIDTPKGKAAEYFKKLAEERPRAASRSRSTRTPRYTRTARKLEALQLGSVQMLAPSLAKFGPLGVAEFEVFDLPYIFDNYDELHKVTQGPLGAALLKKLEAKGIVGPRLLGQRLQGDERQQAASARRPTTRASRCASSRRRCWRTRCARSARCRR